MSTDILSRGTMRWTQFSLLTLGGLVAFTAVASAALVYASELWSSALFTTAIAWLTLAILAAVYRDGRSRAFWIGSAVSGWIYLVLVFWPASDRQQYDAWYTMEISSELATSRLAHWSYKQVLPKLRKPPPPAGGGFGGGVGGGGAGGSGGNFFFPGGGQQGGGPAPPILRPVSPTRSYPDEATFVRVSHAVWTWFIALAGGGLGGYLYSTRQTPDNPRPT